MIKNYVNLKSNKIRIACDFHSAKYEFTRGRILNVDKVNVSFIEHHKFLIKLNSSKSKIGMFNFNINIRFKIKYS